MSPRGEIRALINDFHVALHSGDLEAIVASHTGNVMMEGFRRDSHHVRDHFRGPVEERAFESLGFDVRRSEIVIDGDRATAGPVTCQTSAGDLLRTYRLKLEDDGGWRILDYEDSSPADGETRMGEWLRSVLGPEIVVIANEPLIGGISSDTTRLRISDGHDGEQILVMRRFTQNFEERGTIAEALRFEAAVLGYLADHLPDVRCPQVVATDYDGSIADRQVRLNSWVPGRVIVNPEDKRRWAQDLARALAAIHRLNPDDSPAQPRGGNAGHRYVREETPPIWTSAMDAWESVIAARAEGVPNSKAAFCHGDYHPTNVLWDSGSIGGIIDWGGACAGPVGLDLAHCRANLVSMHGLEIADEFVATYREIGPEESRDDALQARYDADGCWMDVL